MFKKISNFIEEPDYRKYLYDECIFYMVNFHIFRIIINALSCYNNDNLYNVQEVQ